MAMQSVRLGVPNHAEARGAGDAALSIGSDSAVLEVRHMSVEYANPGGAVHAVDDVSFTLARGQILGLAGESGSGKSTLVYAVARLLRPPAQVVQGQVLYYPRPPAGATAADAAPEPIDLFALTSDELRAFRWRRLSIVFQSAMSSLNPVLDVGTQISDVLRAHDPTMSRTSRTERAAELLRLVGIAPDRLRSFPHELSGGMRQRTSIAIALALDPEIVIMDEPTTALDVVVQREILAEIAALRERLEFSVIFITHDLSLLLEIADQVAIMYAGRLVEVGTSEQLRSNPRHPYTYGLAHSFPKLHGPRTKLAGIPGAPPDLRSLPTGCAFHPRCPFAFEACRRETPALPACWCDGESRVACHLYDARVATSYQDADQSRSLADMSGRPAARSGEAPSGESA